MCWLLGDVFVDLKQDLKERLNVPAVKSRYWNNW